MSPFFLTHFLSFASLRLGVFALNFSSSVPIFRPHGWVPNLGENRSEKFLAKGFRSGNSLRRILPIATYAKSVIANR